MSYISFSNVFKNIWAISERLIRIFIIADIGTARNIPGTPQIYPQNNNDNKITTGCKPRFSPNNFGSKILPIKNWVAIKRDTIMMNDKLMLNCKNSIGITATIANIDPIFGIKFKKKVMDASSNATSTLNENKIINVMTAVKKDVKNFVAM